MSRKPMFKDYDMGDGFKVLATNQRTWTEYHASQLNAEGYVINGRSFTSCYRREVDAKIAEWKAQDATIN